MTADRAIDSIQFTDGVLRPVFLDADGRQFVLDDDGDRAYGEWIYVDEPEIVTPVGSRQ